MSSDSPPKSKLRKFFHSSGSTEHSINLASLKENAKSAWHGFKLTSKNVEKFLDGTPLKIPVGVINALIALVDAVIDNHDSMAILLLPIGQRLHIVSTSLEQKRRPRGIDSTCKRFIDVLTNTANQLETLKEQGLFKRIFESAETPKQLKDIFRRVDEATKNFELELTLATVREVEGIVQNTEIIRLRDLKPCHEAKYAAVTHDSCVQGTREAIIESVLSWSRDPDSPPIFWLSGMAGTGKSTIAYTICSRLYDEGNASQRLGGSFFCSRQIEARRLRRNVIPTIAYDLSHSFPPFGRALLTSKFDAQPPPLRDHIRSLLLDPWRSISANQSLPPLAVIIDALDELEQGEGTDFLKELMKEITQHHEDFQGLKFFVTSRQDPHIVDVCASIPPSAVYRLETTDADIVEKDITLYLRTKLPTLTKPQLQILAKRASGLFIYAATVVRFILPQRRSKPDIDRVKLLVESWPNQSQRGANQLLIDQLYEDILLEWISSEDMSMVDKRLAFSILQTVISTEEPVLVSDIPQLMIVGDVRVDKVEMVIRSLHAVLFLCDHRVYSYHKSFDDFILDKTHFAAKKLAVMIHPPLDVQVCLATACFRLMRSLRFNICDLPSSFLYDSEVENLQQRVDDRISTPLRYACRHWATHFAKALPSTDQKLIMEMFSEWQEQCLLFWIEAMNLLKVIGECYPLLVKARQSLGVNLLENNQDNLMAGENLVTIFGGNISKSTPHLYISALAVSSRDSTLMAKWRDKFPRIPTMQFSLGGSPLLVLPQNKKVRSVTFSPDGTRILAVLWGNTAHIFDVAMGNELFKLESTECVCWSPDGTQIVSGLSSIISVCDASTGKLLQRLEGHDNAVKSISFSSDGTRVAFGTSSGTVHIRDTRTWKQLYRLDGHNGEVKSVSFSQDGIHIATGSDEGNLCVWDISEREKVYERRQESDCEIHSVKFSPDGRHVISGSYRVTIWDASTGKNLEHIYTRGYENWVSSIGLSPDGSLIICGSNDMSLNLWDTSKKRWYQKPYWHTDTVTSVGFSPDGTRIVSGSYDKSIHIWDTSTLIGKKVFWPDGHTQSVSSVSFSPCGKYIASGSWDGTVRIWNASNGKQLHRLQADDLVYSVKFSPDGQYIIFSSITGMVYIWDMWKGKYQCINPKIGVEGKMSVSFSPKGTQIGCGADAIIYIWDLSRRQQTHRFVGHEGSITSIGFSPDGMYIISGSQDGTVRIWDMSTGKQVGQLNGHIRSVVSVCFSSDGTRIISGSSDKTIRIWDVSTREQIFQLDAHSEVTSVSLSSDGTRLVYGSVDSVVHLWDLSANNLYRLVGHDSSVHTVDFSPDGTRIVSGSQDRTVRVWNVSAGFISPTKTLDKDRIIDVFPTTGKGDFFSRPAPWMFAQLDAINTHWCVHPDGWITSSNGQCHMWLSPRMHECLQRPDCLVISAMGSIDIDFRTGRFGEDWASCYDPNMV